MTARHIPLHQRGLTLVEILVAMVLMLLVTLATVSLYSVNSQSYKTVDSSQELNDSARFAFEVIGQAMRIAGYQEYMNKNADGARAGGIYAVPCTALTQPCPIIGFNNSTIAAASIATANFTGATDSGGVNLSDTLAITFSGASQPLDAAVADGSVVDCQGVAQPSPASATDLGLSLFWVRMVNNEPELSCISRGTNAGATRTTHPIIRGMESFQVMYGLDQDGVDTLPSSLAPDRWVSAQSIPDLQGWTRVRAVRVGFILRGPPGSAQRPTGTAALTTAERTYFPLGEDFTGGSTEAGLKYVAPDDGRLRRAYSTTYMLRNSN